ncbi:MAG: tryptophan synthase subunit alpha [Tepidisphaeraceae bacterium]|jgi:tryptophan synthase alpha chain
MPPAPLLHSRSLAQSFAALHGRGIGLVPFIPAGFPDLTTTQAVLESLNAPGIAAIEVGFPFSDPIADGPIIQQAFTAALAAKLKVPEIFQTVQSASPRISVPLVAMVSFSIVFRYGPQRFFADARDSGFGGVIIPDLPPPQAQSTCRQIRDAALDTILLVAPTTPLDRRRQIVSLCSGFVYYLSLSGITGVRDHLPPDILDNVRQLKSLTDLPICVGFGISKPQHLAWLAQAADAAVVGSAIVQRMAESASAPPAAVAQSVAQFCRQLLGGQ